MRRPEHVVFVNYKPDATFPFSRLTSLSLRRHTAHVLYNRVKLTVEPKTWTKQ